MFCLLRKWWNPLKGYCLTPFEANSSPFVKGVGNLWVKGRREFIQWCYLFPPEIVWRITKSTCLQVTLQKPLPSHNFDYKGKERLKCSVEEFIRILYFHQKTHSLKINPSLKSEHFQLFSTMTKNACFVCKHVVLRREKNWFSDYIKCLILMEMDKVWGCHLFGFYPGSCVLVLVKVLHRFIWSTLAYYTDGLSYHFTHCFGHKQCKRLPGSYSWCRRQKA